MPKMKIVIEVDVQCEPTPDELLFMQEGYTQAARTVLGFLGVVETWKQTMFDIHGEEVKLIRKS